MRSGQYAELRVKLMSLEAGWTHGQDFDGMCEERDAIDAAATNAVILDLPPIPKQAIHAFYLDVRWVHPLTLSPCVMEGLEAVANGLRRKGIL